MSRFKTGDRVLVIGNAHGMNIQNVKWPLKGYVYNESRSNIPHVGCQHQEHYQVIIDDQKVQRELAGQGYQAPTRWMYPTTLLRRDKFCQVCNAPIETYGGDRNLVSEHGTNGNLCYGSHSPLEL